MSTNETETDYFAGLDREPKAHGFTATDATQDMRGRLSTAADAERYILSGKAVVTLVSAKTGTRFSYRITATDDRSAYFVGVLTGPDNTTDYQYLGRIARGIFWLGRKNPKPGDIGKDAPSARAFDWTWRQLAKRQLPEALEVWHEGRCGRCGRKLTVPASVALGFGPECEGKLFS